MSAADSGPATTVTVIIPTRNRSGLLAEAVESVRAQTYPVHEILIVDDQSDDHHRRRLAALAATSPVIRVHELTKHHGRSRARNEGLRQATGTLVLFLDDDDLLDPAMVASAVTCFLTGTPADVVVCRGQFIGDIPAPHARPINPFYVDSIASRPAWLASCVGSSMSLQQELQRHPTRTLLKCIAPINAFVVRRQAIGLTRFAEDLDYAEDWVFWLDLAIKGCRFHLNPSGRVYVRLHDANSPTTGLSPVAWERVLTHAQGLGPQAAFLAAARLTTFNWSQGNPEWRRAAVSLLKFPTLLLKYGSQFLARRAYRLWLRGGGVIHPADPALPEPGGIPRGQSR